MAFRKFILLCIFLFFATSCTTKTNNNGLSITTFIKDPINLDFSRNFGNKIYFRFFNTLNIAEFNDFPSLVIDTLSRKGYRFVKNRQGADYVVNFRIVNINKKYNENNKKYSYILNSLITIEQNIDGKYISHSSQVITRVKNFTGTNIGEVFSLLEIDILNSLRQIF